MGMPLYRYACESCGSEVVLLRSVSEKDQQVTCACGESMRRVFSPSVAVEIRTVTGYSKVMVPRASEPIFIRRHRNWTPPEDFLRKKMPPKIF